MPKKRNKIKMPSKAHGWKSCILNGCVYVLRPTKGWKKESKLGDLKKHVNTKFLGLEKVGQK